MISEETYAQAMMRAAQAEKVRARRRDGVGRWDTSTNFPGQDRPPKRGTPLREAILKALAGGPMITAEIAQVTKRKKSSVVRTLKEMVEIGLLDREPQEPNHLYSLRPEAEMGDGG